MEQRISPKKCKSVLINVFHMHAMNVANHPRSVAHVHVVHTNRSICIRDIELTIHCYAFCFVYCVCILVSQVWPNSTTVWPDFTHPSVDQYWTSQISQFHSNVQFDGLWIDMNEPSNFVDGSMDGCPISSFEVPPFVPSMPCLACMATFM